MLNASGRGLEDARALGEAWWRSLAIELSPDLLLFSAFGRVVIFADSSGREASILKRNCKVRGLRDLNFRR